MTLIYDVIFRIHGGIPRYRVDWSLDLDSALMESAISPLVDWLYDADTHAPSSPGSRAPLTASSSLSSSQSSMTSLQSYITKSERRRSEGISHRMKLRSIHPPTHNRSSLKIAKNVSAPPPVAPPEPEPLVLHMPRPVLTVQFINFSANSTTDSFIVSLISHARTISSPCTHTKIRISYYSLR